ncbi:TetR/AcrR family transcriptional regulator [Brachybacterium fresconis]|uniref:AcrR family transcriptional regulator n=1 Tax=Brachybacterium fresconis TaxID=173363 RepID=A0ABS4YL84_9MICO|nr:TetR family transcriptional regulator [Brachybacterium fresconis]MBP2409365.1 AcrR family transcriptional regulator [Brachybacterium fresconis]
MPENPRSLQRPLRADAENSIARILEAAEHVFAADPTASLAVVAEAAGVARTTVHRRFSSREDLRDALVDVVNAKLREAIAGANVDKAPPLVALYQLTVATLDLKVDWRASWQFIDLGSEGARGIDPDNIAQLDSLLQHSLEVGLLRPGVDIRWVRNVYMALIHEAATARPDGEASAQWANLIMRTLLGGVGSTEHDLELYTSTS